MLDYDEEDDNIMKKLRKLSGNYHALNKILQGKDCSVVVVFNPDVLSLKESERLIEGLHDLNLPVRLFINNKITEENSELAAETEKSISRIAKDIPFERVSLSKTLLDGGHGSLYNIPEIIITQLQER